MQVPSLVPGLFRDRGCTNAVHCVVSYVQPTYKAYSLAKSVTGGGTVRVRGCQELGGSLGNLRGINTTFWWFILLRLRMYLAVVR